MSEVVDATCVDGIVTAEGQAVSGATKLSEGVASSEGALLLNGSTKIYVAKTSGDLKDVLTTLASLLNNAVTVLTAHDVLVAGANAATIALIASSITELTTKKEALK